MKRILTILLFAPLLLAGCGELRQTPATPAPVIPRATVAPDATRSPGQDALEHGDVLFDRGDLNGAIAAYSQAIALAPDDPAAYNNRAFAEWHNDDTAAAFADFSRAIELRPDYVNALTNRAFIQFDNGNFEACIADATRALATDPEDDSAYMIRGNAYGRVGQYGNALQDWLQANRIRQAKNSQ